MASGWVDELIAAGAVPASYVPEASLGRTDLEALSGAELVEGERLAVHRVSEAVPRFPATASFLDGIQRWRVVGYAGAIPVIRARVAAAVRRRGQSRRLYTTHEAMSELAITCRERLPAPLRRAVDVPGLEVVDLREEDLGQPARALEAARVAVDAARGRIERRVGMDWAAVAGEAEWLIVDGVLSEHTALAEHPRALGVVKSHGAQFFDGADLERALTLPAGCRTSVFRTVPRGRRAVYSWYLRLWPWEGRDLLYGLVRIEARAAPATLVEASAWSAWLLTERAPAATADARWDRLLYPIHDVERYLLTRIPRDLLAVRGARLPRTGT